MLLNRGGPRNICRGVPPWAPILSATIDKNGRPRRDAPTNCDSTSNQQYMNAVTILLRFIFAAVLAGSLALLGGIPFPASLIFVVTVGVIAAVWGDKFLLGFMSLMRYLR